MSHRIFLTTLLFCLTLFGSGCFSSKWAMRDPDYARKYGKPYPSSNPEKWRRMGKQLIDARHVEGKGGLYAKGGYSSDPKAALSEVGIYGYAKSWVSGHAGLSMLLGESDIFGFPGLDLGLRFQSPSRFAPFVGAGVYTDLSEVVFGDDEEDEFHSHDPHEEDNRFRNVFAAVYPEVGFHYWLTSGMRMTGSAGYYFSTAGRDHDFLMIGLSFGCMPHPAPEDCAAVVEQNFTAEDLKILNEIENASLDESVDIELPAGREASFRAMYSEFLPPQDQSIKINLD